jgi:choline dehydrogenase
VRFDVLVIGGGTAGCVVAARLSENPDRTVCLVEAGPDYGPRGDAWPADLLRAHTLASSHDWDYEGGRSSSRARVIGGCSAHNACAIVWGSREDYDEWSPWSFEQLEPYLLRAEEMLGTREFSERELTPWHQALLDGAAEVGVPRLRNLNDLDGTTGAAPFPLNARGTTRWNTAFAYLDPARGRPNLTVVADALVDRVLIEGGVAVGAVVADAEIRARRLVLCAGAYASPAILLRSGIGPADELRRHGIASVLDELPVGDGLVDHPGVGVSWAPSDELDRRMRAHEHEMKGFFEPQVLVRLQSTVCDDDTWDAHLLPWVTRGAELDRFEASCVAYALKPVSRGRVGLRSRDPSAGPAIDHGFLSDDRDVTVVVDAVRALRRIAESSALAAVLGPEERPGPGDLGEYVRAEVRGIFHPVATCALGRVVDESGEVHGCPGLSVADASVLPTIPRANTNLSTVAVAELLAHRIGASQAG